MIPRAGARSSPAVPRARRPTVQDEEHCARVILSRLARRAYRRPVADADVAPLLRFFRMGRADGGSFDAGIQLSLKALLVSPDFLFRVERDPVGAAAAHPVSDVELASRLSFFLWSSIPDEELLALAEKGKLRNPAVLEAQVRRMLSDRKSNALVANFAGQWLYLRNLTEVKPDPDRFPEFDQDLCASRSGARRRCSSGRSSARIASVLDALDADFSYLNERLARHYGVAGVKGAYFAASDARGRTARRYPHSGQRADGILLSDSHVAGDTREVGARKCARRAAPPPPPPNVPDLKEASGDSPATLRQRQESTAPPPRARRATRGCDPLGASRGEEITTRSGSGGPRMTGSRSTRRARCRAASRSTGRMN